MVYYWTFTLTDLESEDCKFFTDNKVAHRTGFPQMCDKPTKPTEKANKLKLKLPFSWLIMYL